VSTPVTIVTIASGYDEAAAILLGKILGSVKQDIHEAKVHKMEKTDLIRVSADEMNTAPCLVLSFGMHPRNFQLQIDNQPYGLRSIGKITYIFSRSLGDLPERPSERKALWEALRRYYKI